ncbi:hypothetical protein CAPTEDRAFT_167071 [Capitella teleta]|uniref:carnitine O-palmitoyltransferase n=1 Tax=Capitella teleta TaxID=283909 RepID=R7U9L8_CAPTE|nr:hypothetical protein CAPTEDRAFT_167071 [Capitella teleta]|eukprot:ELU00493.1 hypothetical protein CAPTEDRAFT_167071 [Capitella teleta]
MREGFDWIEQYYGEGRHRTHFYNTIFPAPAASFPILLFLVLVSDYVGYDFSFGLTEKLEEYVVGVDSAWLHCRVGAAVLMWFAFIATWKYSLRALLSYTAWIQEGRGQISMKTRIWAGLLTLMCGRSPMTFSYQGCLPRLPVPTVHDTMKRYLLSVRPLYDDEEYSKVEKMAHEFEHDVGKRLQKYLLLKSWWSTNYVSDWWEEYVYLRGRSPIMINSNFYGVDAILKPQTHLQAARAANVVHCMIEFKRQIETEEMQPRTVNKHIPLCSMQYRRLFNTTRIPGIEVDQLVHINESHHIVVYHKGRYYKIHIHNQGRYLQACELEVMLQEILDSEEEPAEGEEHLAALTAGYRTPWAEARKDFFGKGFNKTSLDAIEKSAFVLVLDDEAQDMDNLDDFGRSMLHGNGCNRWFDKSFTLVVTSNARIGFNAEHSWADAPIMGHLWEYVISNDFMVGYLDDGHTKGVCEYQPPYPMKLQWEMSEDCLKVIQGSRSVAEKLICDVDLHLVTHDAYGKGLMKSAKLSPDAYLQMALQLAYFRERGRSCLTYEACSVRLYRDGRTETIRSCSLESVAFAKAMCNPEASKEEKQRALKAATARHTATCRQAMTGDGVDRHLFSLYVVARYLEVDSPLLNEALGEPWRLSTSQTPTNQTDFDMSKYPDLMSAGGGFGPVTEDGYGVSYIIAGENVVFFHISSKKSCDETDSKRFGERITKAMKDMSELFM